MIMEEELSLAALDEIDGGKIGRLIKSQLKRAADDCNDRPADDRSRKVTIEIELIPVCSPQGVAEAVKTRLKSVCKIPHHQTKQYEMRLTHSGSGLSFNRGDLESVRQHVMFDTQEDENDE